MKNKIFIALIIVIFGFSYLITANVFLKYFDYYGIPFGKDDIDNYIKYHHFHNKRIFFDNIIDFYLFIFNYKYSFGLTILIPIVGFIILPIVFLLFYYFSTKDIESTFIAILMHFFGTFYIWAFLIVGLWRQTFADIFFFSGLTFLIIYKDKKLIPYLRLSIILLFLACLMHVHYALFIILIITVYSIIELEIKILKFIIPFCFIIFLIFPKGIIQATILSNHYLQSNPLIAGYFFIAPFITIAFFYYFGFRYDRQFLIISLIWFISLFSHNSRMLLMTIPLFINQASSSMKYLINSERFKKFKTLIYIIFIALLLTYTNFIYKYFISQMFGEMIGYDKYKNRIMDYRGLRNILGMDENWNVYEAVNNSFYRRVS